MFETKAIMQTDLITVTSQTLISEAIQLLVDNDISGLPVVDDNMTLVGMITEKDILKSIPDLETLMLSDDEQDSPDKVEDFMTKDVVSFDQNEDLIAICECLTKSSFRRVPIVSEGKLVGIISRKDLIEYILEPIG
jgi:CBS domain-containing protein